jgi:hypothetical protein
MTSRTVLLEKLIVPRLFKKFYNCNENRKCIAVFTRTYHRILSTFIHQWFCSPLLGPGRFSVS